MDRLIAAIEESLPDLRWLLRSVGDNEKHISGAYYAHICSDDHSESYDAAGSGPFAALDAAFGRAMRARGLL